MTVLADVKAELADELIGAGIASVDHIPSRITPPLAIISPAGTYISQGDTFTSFELGLEITLIAQTASNPKAQESLDDAIVTAIGAIPIRYRITSVDQPFALQTGNAEYLATRINVTTNITI